MIRKQLLPLPTGIMFGSFTGKDKRNQRWNWIIYCDTEKNCIACILSPIYRKKL